MFALLMPGGGPVPGPYRLGGTTPSTLLPAPERRLFLFPTGKLLVLESLGSDVDGCGREVSFCRPRC